MTRRIKIKVRPQQTVSFPGICVHCSQPAPQTMTVRQRYGRITRLIDVPLCSRCAGELTRQSAEEERLQKMSWLLAGVLGLLGLAIALLVVGGLAGTVLWGFRKPIANAALPEKQAIRQSVTIEAFSWRATTFAFENALFADRFRELNAPRLMEI